MAGLTALLAACGTSAPPERALRAAADGGRVPEEQCAVLTARGGAAVAQGPDGELRGCFRVGPLSPGRYTLQLEKLVSGGRGPSPADRVELAPEDGPPGSTVRISGFGPGARDGGEPPAELATVCWDGCGSGFTQFRPVHWSPDGRFSTEFRVPSTAWLAVDGPRPLRAGSHRIGVCIPSCGGSEQPAEATFRLDAGGPEVCAEGQPCARLELIPAAASPGAIVEVRGWAPLLPPISPPLANGYALHLEEGDAARDDVEIIPFPGGGGATVRLAPTRFTARPGRRWAELSPATPLVQGRADGSFAADPADPGLLGYCVLDGIRISRDGGAHWETVSTTAVKAAPRKPGDTVGGQGPVRCEAPVPDRRHPGSVFAEFAVVPRGAESTGTSYSAGYYTVDGGRTWQPVPLPPGGSPERFEGFTLAGETVRARFRQRDEASRWQGDAPALDWEPGLLVEETLDGGQTWKPGRDACPSQGPCVSWGPEATYNCAKGRSRALVRRSRDGGRSWSALVWPGWISTCDSTSLVSLPGGDVLLIAADEPFPLLRSPDGGATWHPVTLPEPPKSSPSAPPEVPNLTMLGDGRLLSFAYPQGPHLLDPGADAWCRIEGQPLGPALEARYPRYEPVGDRLWWVDHRTYDLRNVALDDLRCE